MKDVLVTYRQRNQYMSFNTLYIYYSHAATIIDDLDLSDIVQVREDPKMD